MIKVTSKRFVTVFVILLGSLFRFSHLFFININEPFQLGGLFWEFSRQIRLNHYLIPVTIPYYSQGGIPFAYPALPFYFEAIVSDLFHVSPFWIVNILPPFLAALCLPSFYWLAKQVTENEDIALTSLLIYIFVPNSFLNQIQGGGLAEAFGSLALIWFGYFLSRFYQNANLRNAIYAGISLGMCVWASPGSALASALVTLVFAVAVLLRAGKTGLFPSSGYLLAIFLIGVVVSAPYWLTVVVNHGRGIFVVSVLGQFQGGDMPLPFRLLQSFMKLNIAGGGYPFFWNALFLLGLSWAVLKRRWLLVSLFGVLFFIPREGGWITPILAAILAGSALHEWLFVKFEELMAGYRLRRRLAGILVFVLSAVLLYASYDALYEMVHDTQARITMRQITDLEHAREVIPADAHVVVWGTDGFVEWAPSLLQREVVNVRFGLEWQPAKLARVSLFNASVREVQAQAQGWPGIFKTLTLLGLDHVYIIGDKQRLSQLSRASGTNAGMFVPIQDFSSFEVGLLSSP